MAMHKQGSRDFSSYPPSNACLSAGSITPSGATEREGQQLEVQRFPWVLVSLRVAACGSVAPESLHSIGPGELWLEPAGLCIVLKVPLPPSR